MDLNKKKMDKDKIICTCGYILTGFDKYCSQCGVNKHSLIKNLKDIIDYVVSTPRKDRERVEKLFKDNNIKFLSLEVD